MIIRKIDSQEVEHLREIGKHTFIEAFASQNTEQNMHNYLQYAFSKEKLTAELYDPNTEFYVAQKNNHWVGYLKINFGVSKTKTLGTNTLEIERIYVIKAFHGHKIGQTLLEKALDLAKKRKVTFIWLGVWEHNIKAIGFYEKNGFKVFDKHIFRLGEEDQTDLLMKLEIG